MNAKEALDILEANWQTGTAVEALVVLRKAVKERDALKAEVEQYKADALGWKRTYRDQQARAERAEADASHAHSMAEAAGYRLQKAEADLLAARPLIEAAARVDERDLGRVFMGFVSTELRALLEAIRAAKGKANER